MNILSAMNQYLEQVQELESKVKKKLGDDWTVLVHSIDSRDGETPKIPISFWRESTQNPVQVRGQYKVHSIHFEIWALCTASKLYEPMAQCVNLEEAKEHYQPKDIYTCFLGLRHFFNGPGDTKEFESGGGDTNE